jgi:hypothetical protein
MEAESLLSVHKTPLPNPVLSQAIPVCMLTFHFFMFHFNSLPLMLGKKGFET